MIIAAVTVVQALLLAWIIDGIFLRDKNLNDLLSQLIGFFLSGTLRLCVTWFQQKILTETGSKIKNGLRSRLIKYFHNDQIAASTGSVTGDLISLYGSQIDAITQYLVTYLPQLLRALAIPVIVLLFVFPLDLLSAIVFLITASLIPLFMMLIGNMTESAARRKWRQLSRMNAFFLDVIQGLTTIKLFGRVSYFLERINQISNDFRTGSMRVLRIAFLSALVMEMLTTLSTAVIAVEIGLRLLYDHITFSEAMFILIIAPEFYQPMRQLGSRFHIATEGLSAASKYTGYLSPESPKPVPFVKIVPDLKCMPIRFENIYAQYPERNEPALSGITFALPLKGLTVLVGPSGSGKSSLLALLLRFIDPVRGRIVTGDANIGNIAADSWRNRISWVSQDPYLFNRSIRENITIAKPEASWSDIVAASRTAQFDQVAENLHLGYDTVIGEQGIRLSAGERQRLALARVFLRNTPLVLLDEPTASLDSHTDTLIRNSVMQLAGDRTVLMVSHRPEITQQADQVIMLSGGRLVAEGTHDMLIKNNSTYREFIGRADG